MPKLLVALAILLAGAPMGARAGIELHGDLGPGFARSSGTRNGITQSVGGVGAAHSLMLGWAARSGLSAGAEYWGTFVYGPHVEAFGPGGGGGLTYKVYGLGPCLRYQLPSGFFGALTPSVTRVSLSDNDDHPFSWSWGLGLRAAAGREWRTGDRWSLGVAAGLHWAMNAQHGRGTPRWTTVGGGVVLAFGFR